jgi:hypothetical protein
MAALLSAAIKISMRWYIVLVRTQDRYLESYWTDSGWVETRHKAKRYRTKEEAEADAVLVMFSKGVAFGEMEVCQFAWEGDDDERRVD